MGFSWGLALLVLPAGGLIPARRRAPQAVQAVPSLEDALSEGMDEMESNRDKIIGEYAKKARDDDSFLNAPLSPPRRNPTPPRRRQQKSDAAAFVAFAYSGGEAKLAERGGAQLEAQVQAIIEERCETQRRRDYGRADALRDELKELGVEVRDRERTWRFARGDAAYAAFAKKSEAWSRSEADARIDAGDLDVPKVEKLLAQRSEAKKTRDYELADSILAILKGELGVDLDDAQRIWWYVGDGATVKRRGHRYRRVGDFNGDESAVDRLIAERSAARKIKDFDSADEALMSLQRDHSVVLDDGDATWTCTRNQPKKNDNPAKRTRFTPGARNY